MTWLRGGRGIEANREQIVRELSQGDGQFESSTVRSPRRDARPETLAQGEVLAEGVPWV
jgi:hypothetical protein